MRQIPSFKVSHLKWAVGVFKWTRSLGGQADRMPTSVEIAARFRQQDFGLAKGGAMGDRSVLSSSRPVFPEGRDQAVDLRL